MLVALVALAATGCGTAPGASPSRVPTAAPATAAPSPATTPDATHQGEVPSASLAADCSAVTDGVTLDAPTSGLSLLLPKGWRQLLPGDAAWRTVFGNDSGVETSLKDGTMQAFALPLDTPDAQLLSLAVYARPTTESSLLALGEDYASVMQRVIVTDYASATVVGEHLVSLPAGAAYRIEASMHYTGTATPRPDLPTWDDRELAYVLLKDGRSYYLVFRGKEAAFTGQLDRMECMAQSLRLTNPVPR